MKVGVEYNQVEIALQALYGSSEEVIFGAASLRDKQTKDLQQHFLQLILLHSRSIIWQTAPSCVPSTAHLNLVIFPDPFQFALVLVYCFFNVVHLGTQEDSLINL